MLKNPKPVNNSMQPVGKVYPMRTVRDGYDSFQLCYLSDCVPDIRRRDNVALVGVYDPDGVDLQSVYETAYRQIRDYLKQNNVDTESIKHVLFAGGGSCIADLRLYILDKLRNGRPSNALNVFGYFDGSALSVNLADYKDREAVTLSFGNAVALGAALVSSGEQRLIRISPNSVEQNVNEFRAQFVLHELAQLLETLLNEDQKPELSRFYAKHHLI